MDGEMHEGSPKDFTSHLMKVQPDFQKQEPWIDETIHRRGHKVIFLPKFHCELNFIERFWCDAKRYTKDMCFNSFQNLLHLLAPYGPHDCVIFALGRDITGIVHVTTDLVGFDSIRTKWEKAVSPFNMASMNEPASNTASSATHQSQAEARTTSSIPDITQLSLEPNPDIFTIVCCNDSFQLAIDHSTIKTLLRACKRARPLLSFRLPRFHTWCQNAGLCHPDGQIKFGLTPSDQIAISLHCDDQETADRSWLVAQAEHGNAAASYFLARILQIEVEGQPYMERSTQQSIKQRIFHHLESAAEAQHPMAQFRLAECYLNGIEVDKDHTKAAELYRGPADRGIPQAQVALGRCYETGEGVEQSYDTAIEWYSKAADQGSEDGRLHIVFLRGWFSFIGHGVEQSDETAFNYWHEVSTQSTDPVIKSIATHMVGWMHYLGRGITQDKQEGVRIIRDNQSDEFGLGEAECLAYWSSISSNSPAACKFFQVCQLGSDRDWLCRHLMAVCVFHGFGTTEDKKKAIGIFEQLANEGHSDSQLWIGICYCFGRGVSRNYEKALEWLFKSASQGNSYGQWRVGNCYYYGYGVTGDERKAVEWFLKSAEQGNRYGQFWLGYCYQYGRGVPRDIDTAVFWYRKSADQGWQDAIDNLKALGKWP
ncbi:uncharacterized protein BJ171DRAFT_583231 [Polychytrium aggregatum]|uniref:uncharacterized protein n=1 Tax=Polychytrium aggregatum TaxID=110093 RepID=UPI0022FEDAB4|nr:uncharacterized protein BJ171DRAFT_583231 [Polychytrium aggregatum]KAI9203394.1 hypothetical protein BJ171DRAFT_583231 [Polychytrium aggregatum]